jgi:hypothetical protein
VADSYSSFNAQFQDEFHCELILIFCPTFYLSTKKVEKIQTEGQNTDMWKEKKQMRKTQRSYTEEELGPLRKATI